MQLGFIGAGNMAGALARGFGEPVLACDPVGSRAAELVADLGGEALASQAEVAERADVVFLCHKPGQLAEVAAQTDDRAKAVVSILAGVTVATVEKAYPRRPVYRFLPNIPAEVKKGVSCYVPGTLAGEGPETELLELFDRVGIVVRLDEPLIEPAMALMSCGPAFFALTVEALVDAGVRHGLQAGDAESMAVQTMAGAAALMGETGTGPAELRRRVTSPGGTTAAGLAALEAAGLRAAFMDAVSAVVQMARG